MAGSPLANAQEAVETGFGNWDPQKPDDYIDFFRGMPEFFEAFAKAMHNVGSTASEKPLEPVVREKLQEIAGVLAGLHDSAEELHSTFRNAHAGDIDRVENPRQAEETWDVGANR